MTLMTANVAERLAAYSGASGIQDPARLTRLFDSLEAAGLRWCLMGRNTRSYPDRITGDVDILVGRDQQAAVPPSLSAFAAAEGGQIVQARQYGPTHVRFDIAGFGSDGRPWFILADFCSDYLQRGRLVMPAQEILRDRRPGPGGVPIAAARHEFLYYFTKKVEQGKFGENQRRHILSLWREDRQGAIGVLARFFSESHAQAIAAALDMTEGSDLEALWPELRADLRSHLAFSAALRLREWRRQIGRMLMPTGLRIALLGPDGSGKSTCIASLAANVTPAFRECELMHFRPQFGRQSRAEMGAVRDPHGRAPRGMAASLAKLGYYWLDHSFSGLFVLRQRLVRSSLIIFDRYFHDLLVDQRRYRYSGPKWALRAAARFTPNPDLWILLDAPAEIVHARKTEITLDELRQQRLRYLELVRSLPGGHVVDACRPAEEVARSVTEIVFAHLARRAELRLSAISGWH